MSSNDAPDGKHLVLRIPKIPLGIVGELHGALVRALRASVITPGRQVVFALAFVVGAALAGLASAALDLVIPITATMSFFFVVAGGFASALFFSRVRMVELAGGLSVPELARLERAWFVYSSKQHALDVHVRQMRKDGSSQADIEAAIGTDRARALSDYLAVLDTLQETSPAVRDVLQSEPVRKMLGPARDEAPR